MTSDLNLLLSQLLITIVVVFAYLLIVAILALFTYMFLQWFKHRRREGYALDFVTMMVKLPKDNEIKIDATEQMFAGLYSIKQSGFTSFLKPEDFFAFEIFFRKKIILLRDFFN